MKNYDIYCEWANIFEPIPKKLILQAVKKYNPYTDLCIRKYTVSASSVFEAIGIVSILNGFTAQLEDLLFKDASNHVINKDLCVVLNGWDFGSKEDFLQALENNMESSQ